MAREKVHTYFVVEVPERGERILVWDTRRIRVGRSSDNDLVIDHPELSRHHAVFDREGDACFVENQSDTNPTLVNDQRVTRHPLGIGDEVRLCDLVFVFHQGTRNPLTLGPRVEFASRLRDLLLEEEEEDGAGATVLGLGDALVEAPGSDVPTRPTWNEGPDLELDASGSLDPAKAPRDLDRELEDLDFAVEPPPALADPPSRPAGSPPEPKAPEPFSLHLRIRCRSEDLRTALLALVGRSLRLPGVRVDVESGED